MINSRDLRVGNYVMDETTGEWMVVDKIVEKQIFASLVDRKLFPLPKGWEMIPIKLTRKVLGICNVSKFQTAYSDSNYWLDITFIGENGKVWDCDIKVTANCKDMAYFNLHELQNLCKLLTGEELIINLDKLKK